MVHYFREANCCARALARIETYQDSNILFYNSHPPLLLNFFISDLYGLNQVKLCSDNDVIGVVS